MGVQKNWRDIRGSYEDSLLALLDDQTRTAAIEQQWDLSLAAAPIGAILDHNIEILNLAHSAYQFDIANPTSLQLPKRWALVWEEIDKNLSPLRHPRMRRKKKQRTRYRTTAPRTALAAWRLTTTVGTTAAAGGACYLAATQPPVIFWPATLATLGVYGLIRRPRGIEISEQAWIAITKAVAHQRFQRIKPADLEVGLGHKNSLDHVADALLSRVRAQVPPHRRTLPGVLKVSGSDPVPWRFAPTDSRTITPRTGQHPTKSAQLGKNDSALHELAGRIFGVQVQILDVVHTENGAVEKFKVQFDSRTAQRCSNLGERNRVERDWNRLLPTGDRELRFTWDLRTREFTCQKVVPPAQSNTQEPTAPRPAPVSDTDAADGPRRVAGIHAALAQLDQEWLEYESDWHSWSLAKPLLHVPEVPQTAAYNDALYALREITYTLADTASESQIVAGEKAADAALRAWDIAQDHAAAIGIADRSPLEQRTLRRLHHLVGQLADPSTPKPMWQGLITQIDRQLKNLETVPITWSHIQHLSALEASPRIQAIQQFAEVPHA